MEKTKYETRKARSMEMLNNGVEPIKNGFNEYFIPSQTDKSKKYKITINHGWYSCECPDNKEGNLCKHILLLKTYFALQFKAQEIKEKVIVSNPCPHCESPNIRKFGTRKTTMGLKQRWLCKDCNKRFVNEPKTNIKGNLDVVTIAMDLYMRGVSYRGIREHLKQFLGLKVNHVTIMRWVNTYMDRINKYVDGLKPNVSDLWNADEQFIKVKGKEQYVWNVMDERTRFLLASNQSATRSTQDARETFQKAKKIAGKRAETVVTDGSFNYQEAVRKEFATYQNRNPHYRYVSIREHDSNNNNIERFHGTFRQRDKVMRGFKGNQKQYAENFKTFYNFIREHQALKGLTPAQRAGINKKADWRELLISATQHPKSNTPR